MTDVLPRIQRALADAYAVEREIGQGGMATVFLASDLKHKRPVAIKVLRPELAASLGSERFLREIELSAGLQHPHIVPVYDSGEADGFLYYVMPFVDGESLRARLDREGALPVEEAVRLVREAASALAYAHGHGIVHRDIKPDNIMLSGGHAVVADFGIARAIDAATGGAHLTGAGLAIGTPAYMSPEQATASKDIGERSDEYSLACVLYECLTGTAPFAGESAASVITKTVTAARPHPRSRRKEIPAPLDQAVVRAMAKEPGDRFPTVAAFAEALAGAGGRGPLSRIPAWGLVAAGIAALIVLGGGGWWLGSRAGESPVAEGAERIAVLPFSTSGAGMELMGEGMVDLLSTNLNAVGVLQTVDPRAVLKRWSATGHGGGADLQDAMTIARELDAGSFLVGSVVSTGPTVRLTAQLYNTAGQPMGQAQVDGSSDSVLALVDDLSLALMREIWQSEEPLPSLRVGALTTHSVAAMRAYLEGEQYYRRSQWDSARVSFERAAGDDSTFALAFFRLATTLGWQGGFGGSGGRAAIAQALEHVDRLPIRERTLVRAYDLFLERDPAATDTLRAYVARYPDDVDGWYQLGESIYHRRELDAPSPDAMLSPFDRVLAIDSTLTPAAIHPLEIALEYREEARFDRYLALYAASTDSIDAAPWRMARASAWATDADTTGLEPLFRENAGAAWSTFVSMARDPAMTGDRLFDRVWGAPQTTGERDNLALQLEAGRAFALAGLGRLREAVTIADSLREASSDLAVLAALQPVLTGVAPADYRPRLLEPFLNSPPNNLPLRFWQSIYALQVGDTAKARRLVDAGLAQDSTGANAKVRGLLIGARGWLTIARGDTAAGVREIRTALDRVSSLGGPMTAPLRWELALTLASRPVTRAEGIRRLRYGFDQDASYLPLTFYALGKAYEAAGEREHAAEAYGQFVRLWDHPDSTVAGRLDDVRRALVDLTREPRQ